MITLTNNSESLCNLNIPEIGVQICLSPGESTEPLNENLMRHHRFKALVHAFRLDVEEVAAPKKAVKKGAPKKAEAPAKKESQTEASDKAEAPAKKESQTEASDKAEAPAEKESKTEASVEDKPVRRRRRARRRD